MKVQQLPQASHLRPQKSSARDTPHVVIETNTNCNIRCTFCYAVERPMVKTVEAVKAEIDYATSRRNLDAISLLGGEPTLHPQLVEIVQYVKSKGLVCQVLTNGVRFLYHDDQSLLKALVDAGVDRFLVHVDSGQTHVHGDLHVARHKLFRRLEAHQVWFGLSLTLSEGEEDQLPEILKEYAGYEHFDGVLVTLALDFEHAFDSAERREREPDMARVAAAIDRELHVAPTAYIPSNLDDDEVCWLMYMYWLNADTGETFALSPELDRVVKGVYRTTRGHAFFADPMDLAWKGVTVGAAGAAELLLHPSRARQFAQLLRRSGGAQHLRFQYIVIQQAPRMSIEHPGQLQFCWQCPDATVRNGVLTPVCLAGRLNPMGDRPRSAPDEIVAQVYTHLGEPVPE